MLILTIRTDKPAAEIGLYSDSEQLAYTSWIAHRQLAETLHAKIQELLESRNKTLHDLHAIACYAGPGSFTGLRIGLTVGNALAYSLEIPIAAGTGDNWRMAAVKRLTAGKGDRIVLPEYGSEVHITVPKTAPKST